MATPDDYPGPEQWFEAGEKIENFAERLTFYERGLQMGAEWQRKAWRGIGYIRLQQEDYAGALQVFERQVEFDPKDVTA